MTDRQIIRLQQLSHKIDVLVSSGASRAVKRTKIEDIFYDLMYEDEFSILDEPVASCLYLKLLDRVKDLHSEYDPIIYYRRIAF